MQMHAHHIMVRVGQTNLLDHIPIRRAVDRGLQPVAGGLWTAARGLPKTVQKIGDQEEDRAPVQHVVHKCQRGGNVCAAVLGLEVQHLPDQPQDVPAPLARRQVELNLVAEEQQCDLVAAARR